MNQETYEGLDPFGRQRRNFLKAFAMAPLIGSPLARVTNILFQQEDQVQRTRVLLYHEVSLNRMVSDATRLIRSGDQPISLDTFIGALNDDIDIHPDLGTFLITCDDGFVSQYNQGLDAVDIIQRQTGWFIPLTLFAMMRFEGLSHPLSELPDDTLSFWDGDPRHQYMNKGQLIEMLQLGHYVENHTVDHKSLTSLTAEQRRDQVELAEGRVDELWQLANRQRLYRTFAYPYGNYQGQEEYIAGVGFDAAFSTIGTTVHRSSQRYRLGRVRGV